MRRRFTLLSALGLLAALATASSASAQGTVLQVTPQTITPGQTVTVTGGGFTDHGRDQPRRHPPQPRVTAGPLSGADRRHARQP